MASWKPRFWKPDTEKPGSDIAIERPVNSNDASDTVVYNPNNVYVITRVGGPNSRSTISSFATNRAVLTKGVKSLT